MELNKLPVKALPVTKESVIAAVTPEITRLNYESVLKELVSIRVEPGNLVESQERSKIATKLLKSLDSLRVQYKKPHDDNADIVQREMMEFIKPLEKEIARIKNDVATVNASELAIKRRQEEENRKNLQISESIKGFINTMIKGISDANDPTSIVLIQKAIGTEKSRKNYYGQYMIYLETACDTLTPLINQRKEDIRKNALLLEKEKKALDTGDIQTATEIKEEKELLDQKINEDVIRLQQTAFDASSEVQVSLIETTTNTVKGRRLWKWKVNDIKLLAKKRPEWVKLEPDVDAIEAWLTEKRKDGSLSDKDEITIDGITFFIKPSY
jgi:hypothetical protein